LTRIFSRMRCGSKEMRNMVVWSPRLSMYILLQLRSRTGLLPHLRRRAKIERKLQLRGRWLRGEKLPCEYQQTNYTVIWNINERTTRSRFQNDSHFAHVASVSTFEPKDIGHTLSDHNWVNYMHEELDNFERNQVWELVEPPPGCKSIGTK
jgi:hypothetical protein